MTHDEMRLVLMNAVIAAMPEDERAQVNKLADEIRSVVRQNSDAAAKAMMLVTREMQVSNG